jgi:hypothetical protein
MSQHLARVRGRSWGNHIFSKHNIFLAIVHFLPDFPCPA